MGGLLGSLWESSKHEDETSCDMESDSENWLEEIEKDYGHPSWSQLIGKRLSRKKKVTVKVIKCGDENQDKSNLAGVKLSKELERLDSEVREELGVINETPEELDNVRNTLEELGDKNEEENDNVVENIDSGNEVNVPNSPVDVEQVGMESIFTYKSLTGKTQGHAILYNY